MRYLFFLVCCCVLFAESSAQTGTPAHEDEGLAIYLADTLHAADNIRKLVKETDSILTSGQNSEAIERFLVALALEEFAQDSLAARILLHNRFSNCLSAGGAYDLALDHAKTALQLAHNFKSGFSGGLYNQCSKIASGYAQLNKVDSAFHYYRQALKEAEKEGAYLWTASGWNNLGVYFSKNNMPDSAGFCFNNAQSILQLTVAEDSNLLRSIRDNIAMEAIAKNELPLAISNYELNLELTKIKCDTSSMLQTLFGLATVALLQKNPARCKDLLEEAEHFLVFYRKTRYFERKLQLAELWITYFEATNNPKPALEKQKWITRSNDSIAAVNKTFIRDIMQALTNSELSKFEKSMRINTLELQNKQAELAHAKSAELRNLVGIFLSICILVLVYLYWRNRSKAQGRLLELNKTKLNLSEANLVNEQLEKVKIEQELKLKESDLRNKQLEKEKVEHELKLMESMRINEQLEKEKLERELKLKKGDLSDLSIYLTNLKDLNTKIVDKLNSKKNSSKEVKDLVKEINTEIGSQLQSDKKRQLVQENLDSVNKEFYDTLHEQFPDLTRSEIELCGLLRLNMSNKDIGALKNITTESAKVARHRLRKKLNLSSDADIYKFVSRI